MIQVERPMTRAERRADMERAKAKAKRHLTCRGRSVDPANVGRHARTPHPCSCPMGCGNQRRIYGPTRQERLAQ